MTAIVALAEVGVKIIELNLSKIERNLSVKESKTEIFISDL